ncbi:MAG: class I fructose-bisphosphate aldolase [Planctomycetes bacterium]|nr:class I fructose-bisphosphate aldolase [Planctomycetota bacterium]
MSNRVEEILSWYGADTPGVKTNIARLLNTGRLAGTGKLVILPVDQGWEHGPHRSFAKNPAGYDPRYHFELAIEAGCNAYAAPLGALEAAANDYAGEIPLILKVNNNNSLYSDKNPDQAVTASVEDALRLGCVGVGFTIYPGSTHSQAGYEELRAIAAEAKQKGLVVVVWSYPRGEQLSKSGENAVDVVSYAAHIAAQLGAHIIKVKPPTANLEQDAARKVYEEFGRPIGTLKDRIADVVQSTFAGRRIVIFSGGEAKGNEQLLAEVKEIAAGGAFGSIMGRNAFQRPKAEALQLLKSVQDIYRAAK